MYQVFYSPGDGFEPPLKEPESFVLPLDDPGLFNFYGAGDETRTRDLLLGKETFYH